MLMCARAAAEHDAEIDKHLDPNPYDSVLKALAAPAQSDWPIKLAQGSGQQSVADTSFRRKSLRLPGSAQQVIEESTRWSSQYCQQPRVSSRAQWVPIGPDEATQLSLISKNTSASRVSREAIGECAPTLVASRGNWRPTKGARARSQGIRKRGGVLVALCKNQRLRETTAGQMRLMVCKRRFQRTLTAQFGPKAEGHKEGVNRWQQLWYMAIAPNVEQ